MGTILLHCEFAYGNAKLCIRMNINESIKYILICYNFNYYYTIKKFLSFLLLLDKHILCDGKELYSLFVCLLKDDSACFNA